MADRADVSTVSVEAIPVELRNLRQWIAWRAVARADGRMDKIPVNPHTGGNAAVDAAMTWGTLGDALNRARRDGLAGIGFVFSADDPYTGIDFDGCRDPATGSIDVWAYGEVQSLDSYAEISPSGRGIHAIIRGRLSGLGGTRSVIPTPTGHVEVYDHGRFFTVTGQRVPGAATDIADRQVELDAWLAAYFPSVNGRKADEPIPPCDASTDQWRRLLRRCYRIRELEEKQRVTGVSYHEWLNLAALARHGGEAGRRWVEEFTEVYGPGVMPEDRTKLAEWLDGGLTGAATCVGLGCNPDECQFRPYTDPLGAARKPSPLRYLTLPVRAGQTETPGVTPPRPEPSAPSPELPPAAIVSPDLAARAGGWLDLYVEHAMAVSPMTPRAFHESAGLWLASVAIARRLVVRMPFGSVFPNLFILWLAETTLWHKTTAQDYARQLARRAFGHMVGPDEWTPESLLSDMAGQQPNNYDNLPQRQQAEWTAQRNYAAQRGLVVDEMSGLLAAAGRDYNAGMLEALLKMYDCSDRYSRTTRSQGWLIVRNTYMTILGASTPRAMAEHVVEERLWAMGFWPRFALLAPDRARPDWAEPTERDEAPALMGELAALHERLPAAVYPDPPTAQSVTLGTGVFDAWQEYNRAVSYDLLTDDLDKRLWGAYGRLPTQLLKVSTILAALDWPRNGPPTIEMQHFARAMATVESWRGSAHRVLTGAGQTEVDVLDARILRQLGRFEPSGATLRDLARAMRDKRPDAIELALAGLVKLGDVETLESKGPGRPTVHFRLARGDS